MNDAKSGDTSPQLKEESQSQSTSDRSLENHSSEGSKINQISGSQNAENEQSTRIANVCRKPSGNAMGAAVWLSVSDLNKIGVNVEEAEGLKIRIKEGELRLVPAVSAES